MVVAVERAVEAGAHTVVCASTGNTAASAAAYAARAGLARGRADAGRRHRVGEARAGERRRRARDRGPRLVRRRPAAGVRAGERDGYVLVNSREPRPQPDRRPEARRRRDRRAARRRPRRGRAAVRRRRQRERGRRSGSPSSASRRRSSSARRRSGRRPGRRRSASPSPRTPRRSRGLVASGRLQIVDARRGRARVTGGGDSRARRASSASRPRLPAWPRSRALDRSGWQSAVAIVTGHGLKDTGAVDQSSSADRRADARRDPRGARVIVRVLAPASTANLGPGFDSAAAALDLWNEVVVEDGAVRRRGRGRGRRRAAARRVAPGAARVRALRAGRGPALPLRNRIPLERGLGSSAAAIALGLVAGAAAAGRDLRPDELLAPASSARGPRRQPRRRAATAASASSWRRNGAPHAARIADRHAGRGRAGRARRRARAPPSRASALPASVAHEDAAVTAGAAALLGAAIAPATRSCSRDAFADRLHEPYRPAARRRCCGSCRAAAGRARSASRSPAPGRRSSSGRGRRARRAVVAASSRRRFPDTTVLPLEVAAEGATST